MLSKQWKEICTDGLACIFIPEDKLLENSNQKSLLVMYQALFKL